MNSSIVEVEELAEMLLDDVNHGITRWKYEEVWEKLGYEMFDYPTSGTLAYFKWGQRRGKKLIDINNCLERKKETIRIRIAYGSNSNGEVSMNEWRAVPKEEALNWMALESAKKILGPMATAVRRSIGYANANNFSLEVKAMFNSLAAMTDSLSSVVLNNMQSIDGLDEATVKELQEWKKRKIQKYKRLLGETQEPNPKAAI